jgi:DNA invertase Pin-like site-specific DNA recombinase
LAQSSDAWAIDRIGRNLIDLLGTIQHLETCGVDLYLDQQNIDTTTPHGKLLYQITGAFAEFERTMIRQRINAGMARALKHGTKSGKPIGRPRVSLQKEAEIKTMLDKGMGTKAIQAALGVGVSLIITIKRELGIEVGARPGHAEAD